MKTWLTALFCVVRCILFPKTKICIASGTRPQANEVLSKIEDDFMRNYGWGSDNLKREIESISIGTNKAECYFKNGSWIKVVTASDSGRGNRCNILIIDEYRLVDKDVVDTVLRRFATAPRQPNYLLNPKYKHLEERNKEIYMTSAWLKSHWSFTKVKSYFTEMIAHEKKFFVCGLPYQIAILEGLLNREQVEDEMSEADFDISKFLMEMETTWLGDTEGAFFNFDDVSRQRKLKNAFYNPLDEFSKKVTVPNLMLNENRILSVDVALMASSKNKNNDASSIIINSAIPNSSNTYIANIVYMKNEEGLTAEELALITRRLFEQFKCTHLVLDCSGVGLSVADELMKDIYDPDYGLTYRALTCCNNKEMADRCKVENALPVMWCIKASASFNTEMCTLLRNGISSRRINLLIDEFKCEEVLKSKIKNYSKLTPQEQLMYKMPYVQTSLLVYELTKLQSEIKGTNIKISEASGARKDRYSSLGYNYWVQCQLEREFLQSKKNVFNVKEYAKQLQKLNKRPNYY